MSGTTLAARLAPRQRRALCLLALASSVGCGESSEPPAATGGSGAGAGGASAGGAGGSAGSGGGAGGSAGSAGVDAGAGASGSAGSAGTGTGGSGGRPAGCPVPAPVAVPGQTIVIQSVNVNTSELILRNAASTPQSITLGRQGWQWCAYPRYWSLSEAATSIQLAPGDTYSFIAINNQSGPVTLYPDEGEMAIYSAPGVFEEYEYMQGFVAWGEVQAFRESYAVQKGLWIFGERIQIASGHAGFIATGATDRASGYTSAPARCLVP